MSFDSTFNRGHGWLNELGSWITMVGGSLQLLPPLKLVAII